MSYAQHASLNGALGYLSGVNDKVGRGDEVILRFRPGTGVDGPKGDRLAYNLKQLVVGTRHFETPRYAAWGADGNRGFLVVRADTKSDNYTLQQIANFMPGIARRATRESGMPVTFVSAVNEDGDEAFAAGSDGGGGGGGGGGDADEGSGQSATTPLVLAGVLAGVAVAYLFLSRRN